MVDRVVFMKNIGIRNRNSLKQVIRNVSLTVISITLLLNLIFIEKISANSKVMIFSGGGFHSALFLGMLAGAEEAGFQPDYIIGSCGGAVAAAIAKTYKTSSDRYHFLMSQDFFDFFHNIQFENDSLNGSAYNLFKMIGRRFNLIPMEPDLFKWTIFNMPLAASFSGFNIPFDRDSPKIIIVASKIDIDIHTKRVASTSKHIQEVFFTDSETANDIAGFLSPIPALYPHSPIIKKTDIITSRTLTEAVRASIADPYYMKPLDLGGQYYFTGAIDLYPLELAKRLGHEVAAIYPPWFDTVEISSFMSVYKYNINNRIVNVTSQYSTYWIDDSDVDELYKVAGFNPKPDFSSWTLRYGIPNEIGEFRRKIATQWEFGRRRALEAFAGQKNDKLHIRKKILPQAIDAVLENSRRRNF